MRKNSLYLFISILAMSLAFSSCLDSDNQNYDLTSDVAISSFSIGSIAVPDTLKDSSGKDSIVYDSVIGSDYKFTIDQQSNLIYNVDSLPVETNVKKVTTSLSLSYGYAVTYVKNGQDTLWTSSDSIDFTNPVTFKAYALNGSIRQYQVKVNVHQVDPDSLQWTLLQGADLNIPARAQHKAVYNEGRMYLFAHTTGGTLVNSSADGNTWSGWESVSLSGNVDHTSVLALNGTLYMLCDNRLYASSDGINWDAAATSDTFDKLFAASPRLGELYAQSGTNIKAIACSDYSTKSVGTTDTDFLPVQNISYAVTSVSTNPGIERLILTGTRNPELANDTTAVVWTKLSSEPEWTYYPLAPNNTLGCPKLQGLATFAYDGKLYAFGGDYDMPAEVPRPSGFKPFQYLYESEDNGISWHPQTNKVMLPASFLNRTADFSYLVDRDNFIWIFWGPSSQTDGKTEVWRGRINRLGF